jgi:GxxExxY protein
MDPLNRRDTEDTKENSQSTGFLMKPVDTDDIGTAIVESALQIHRTLGPGLLESVYQDCLVHELKLRRLRVQREIPLPVDYKGRQIRMGFRLDLLVEGAVIVENKTVGKLEPIHLAQLLTYLRLSKCTLGYLINWNVVLLKYGIRRVANLYQIPVKKDREAIRNNSLGISVPPR